jgi:hypothetical protein
MEMEEKIYKLGLSVMDELLLHRNVSKEVTVSIEDASVLSDMTVHVGSHGIFAFDEKEIAEFYNIWAKYFFGIGYPNRSWLRE